MKVIIGIDPHKASQHAVAVDDHEAGIGADLGAGDTTTAPPWSSSPPPDAPCTAPPDAATAS